MAARKWLNIAVDGKTAESPHWPNIVSDHLNKIVRSFFDNARQEGFNNSCEVGLLIYNFNSSLDGFDIQCMNWTNNVDEFLAILPMLPLVCNNVNQNTIVKGLAEALVMFPKPKEYFEYERHCVLVASGEPVPQKMLVSLPLVHENKFISGVFRTFEATFLDVAKMFFGLRVSLSVVSPNCHPGFISIFRLGNFLSEDTPVINYGNGQITVLLSDNFRQAHYYSYYNNGIGGSTSNARAQIESWNAAIDATFLTTFANNPQGGGSMAIGQQSSMGVQNVIQESTSTLAPVVPQTTTWEDGSSQQQFSFDEVLDHFLKSTNYLDDEESFLEGSNADGSLFDFHDATENSLNQFQPPSFPVPYGGASDAVGPSASAGALVASSEGIANAGVVAGALVASSEGIANAGVVAGALVANSGGIPRANIDAGVVVGALVASSDGIARASIDTGVAVAGANNAGAGSGGIVRDSIDAGVVVAGANNAGVGSGGIARASINAGVIVDADVVVAGADNAGVGSGGIARASIDAGVVVVGANNAGASSYYGSHNQQLPRHHLVEMGEINRTTMAANTWASPAPMIPQYNQTLFWPKPPTNFKDYVQAWEGCVVGKIHSGTSINQAKAFRRLTSPVTLTDQWSIKLDIVHFIPKKAVNYTMRTYGTGGPIDHMFIQVTKFNNVDMYEYLISNNLCAKIILPFRTVLLSTTEVMHQYLGLIFPGDMIFVERH